MAIVYLQCKMWVIFFYILAVSLVSSNSNYHYYDVDTSNLVLKDSSFHTIIKRETNIKETKVLQNVTIYNQIDNNNSSNVTTQTTKNVTAFTPHNLGVNGTGQRKDMKSVVNNDTHNVTFQQNVTLNKNVLVNVTMKPEILNATTIIPPKQNTTNDDDIAISHHLDEIYKKSVEIYNNKSDEQHQLTTREDSHEYYTSKTTIDPSVGEKYWVNMSNMENVKVNELLSKSHRRAATVKLSFDFPFYGHLVRNVTIATGGFLYTGEYVHSWLAATQYIAPLMANFDTSLSNDSYIKYVDNGTSFTVQWERVSLQDRPNDGEFTFQATLRDNGDIVFVYQNVPVIIENIQDEHHPVKVGLSDAYIIDRTIFFVRRKTIYEYHRVHFNKEDIKNWTVIYLSALPTCLTYKDCNSCLSAATSNFSCMWCPGTDRCSSGMDRYRQEWLLKGCERRQIKNESQCSDDKSARLGYNTDDANRNIMGDGPEQASRVTHEDESRVDKKSSSVSVSGMLSIIFIVGLLATLGMWVLYAYRNPHSASGQLLIRYRPNQWSWRRGEARYTAATIHM